MKIYVIFIVAYLTEQLKADVYSVKLERIIKGDNSLATVEGDADSPTSVIFVKDVKPEDLEVTVTFLDYTGYIITWFELDDPCDMDPSTGEGTIAAILWKTFGIDSCSIAAGKYPTVQNFTQTGAIDVEVWKAKETLTIIFDVTLKANSKKSKKYFRLLDEVTLL